MNKIIKTNKQQKKRIYEKRKPNISNTCLNIYTNKEHTKEMFEDITNKGRILLGFWDIDKTALVSCKIYEKYGYRFNYMFTFYK